MFSEEPSRSWERGDWDAARDLCFAEPLGLMLYADKAALENRTKVKLLTIRERELTLYTNNCRTVGTVSALMAGIAYSALVRTASVSDGSPRRATC